ncbi:uncharacterized protein LOC111709407 [Eurytemora carolleeae]|uniref:uncharacterized protein LOC111709407 n=1 Tax=Eurytemora carolleeae TaxID=1294199 RepID=UPI000C769C1A|nr:uncharacterized protein LOC111709407 [Eurytemora carolleeae]|eukprot:XP_023338834.1 uncharacterized protein LOC111709407 [Eurytemora affinis]
MPNNADTREMPGFISLVVLSLLSQGTLGEFILPSINIDDESYETCGYCDERSDRAGSRTTANSLREFMTRNFIKIAVDSGDVAVSENLPNEKIDTGHSCRTTAQAQNVIARARMIPGTVDLGPTGVLYIDEIQNSIAIAEVEHMLSVDLDVR